MNIVKTLLFFAVGSALAVSCLDDKDNYYAGFPVSTAKHPYIYANNVLDTLYVVGYGDWSLSANDYNGNWCHLSLTGGQANVLYTTPVTFDQNTTGQARSASYTVTDNAHPDIQASFGFIQYATRGDGSLGNAAEVKTITGSDGSLIELDYDEQHRPLRLTMKKNDERLHDFTFTYSDYDSLLSVRTSNAGTLTGKYNQGYQPAGMLLSGSDTVMYRQQTNSFEQIYSSVLTFNIEFRRARGEYMAQALRAPRSSLAPDSIHNSDSLRYQHRYVDGTKYTQLLKLNYSKMDNRCQSVDVNQLLLGVEECNPYQLLSLFRYGRNSNIISSATSGNDTILMEAQLNSDKSVSQLTVSRGEHQIVYTFKY